MNIRSRKQQERAVAAGKCYICLEASGTINDGIGGKLCQSCAENVRQVMIKHALSQPGYSLRKRGVK